MGMPPIMVMIEENLSVYFKTMVKILVRNEVLVWPQRFPHRLQTKLMRGNFTFS